MSHSDKQIQIPLTVNGNYRWISVTVEPTILEQVQKGLSLTSQYRLVIESKQLINPSLAQNTDGIDNSFRNTATTHTDMTPINTIEKCILCGKSNATSKHPGNIFYKQYMKENRGRYQSCSEAEKKDFIEKVYHNLHENNHKFLLSDADNSWKEMDKKEAVKKIGQALREKRLQPDVDETPSGVPEIQTCSATEEVETFLDNHFSLSNEDPLHFAQNTQLFDQHYEQRDVDNSTARDIFTTPPRKVRKVKEAHADKGSIAPADSTTFTTSTKAKREEVASIAHPSDLSALDPYAFLDDIKLSFSPSSIASEANKSDRDEGRDTSSIAGAQCPTTTTSVTRDDLARENDPLELHPRQNFDVYPNEDRSTGDDKSRDPSPTSFFEM